MMAGVAFRFMAENLFVRLIETDGQPTFEWLLLDDMSGVIRVRGDGDSEKLREFTRQLSWAGSTIVLIPGENVFLTRAKVPSRKPRQILQALPFAVEDQLSVEVEQTHLAMGARSEHGEIHVAVIDQDLMRTWRDMLETCGIQPRIIVPDTLCVPRSQNEVSILLDGNRVLFHVSTNEGMVVEREQVSLLLELLANGASDIAESKRTFHIFTDASDEHEVLFLQWQAELDRALTNEVMDYPPFETLCRGYHRNAINLLQGDFSPESVQSTTSARWSSVAALLVIGVLLHVSFLVGKGIYLNTQADKYLVQSETLYKEIYPNDKNVRDMRRRWRAHIEGTGMDASGANGFLDVFSLAAAGLNNSKLQLDNINYNQQRGDLILQLRASASDQLVAYSQEITNAELVSEIGTISQEADWVKGSVKIRSKGVEGS
jgi:general secretion pathway protein L